MLLDFNSGATLISQAKPEALSDIPSLNKNYKLGECKLNIDIQISGITQYVYCPLHYLITYILGMDDANSYIVAGNIAHKNVDQYAKNVKTNGVIEYSRLAIYSEQYRLYGYCDLVSFIPDNENGAFVEDLNSFYRIVPIEYKVKYHDDKDELYRYQCILQALCLEEMFHTTIKETGIYYADINKRIYKKITPDNRETVITLLGDMRQFHTNGKTMIEELSDKCRGCAKYYLCYPPKKSITKKTSTAQALNYFVDTINQIKEHQ